MILIKSLRILFSNGEAYDIPAGIIADSRAKYYAFHDTKIEEEGGDLTKEWWDIYKKERKYTLDDEYEIIDWAKNNMNWEDVVEEAVRVAKIDSDIDKHKEWMENDLEIIK